ncbi:HNH endonuclease [Rapidithrix thailandica]|uniref:HNH endonuclease n=1 Tax=Rapidithrix thailandica TaxID=413964 RepID=A0AAW9RTC2_9BACT
MTRKVLILNADYRAISICNAYKAFLLVYLGKAEVIRKVHDVFLHSVNRTFDMPSVIRLQHYVKIPYRGVILTRQNIFKRDGNRCVYCNSNEDLTLDHVIPKSRGGKTTWNNLVSACKSCNSKKGDYLPDEVDMPLPYQPYKPSFIVFLKHFSGVKDDSWQPYLEINR